MNGNYWTSDSFLRFGSGMMFLTLAVAIFWMLYRTGKAVTWRRQSTFSAALFLAWFKRYGKIRIRTERRAENYEALVTLAACLICCRNL